MNMRMKKVIDAVLVLVVAIGTTLAVAGIPALQTKKKSAPGVAVDNSRLFEACRSGNSSLLAEILPSIENFEVHDPTGGSTPLSMACFFDHPEVVRMLLSSGADIDGKNKDGGTAVHTAAFFCRVGVLEILLMHDPDLTMRNGYGQTAYETVTLPWPDVEGIYRFFKQMLPAQVDLEKIRETRPVVADMLREHSSGR